MLGSLFENPLRMRGQIWKIEELFNKATTALKEGLFYLGLLVNRHSEDQQFPWSHIFRVRSLTEDIDRYGYSSSLLVN